MQERTLDLLIIGGGITGAGVALQAAASGLDTGLIEMQDFAEGTSSRSTKLVHGGLRYLKQFDVEVVSDTVSEFSKLPLIFQNQILCSCLSMKKKALLSASFASKWLWTSMTSWLVLTTLLLPTRF